MKKRLICLISACMLTSLGAFAVPQPETVESARNNCDEAVETASVTAQQSDAPGLNELTGTSAALDFEDMTSVPDTIALFGDYMKDLSITDVPSDIGGNTSQKALKFTRNTNYKNFWLTALKVKVDQEWERPYHVSFDIYTDMLRKTDSISGSTKIYIGTTSQPHIGQNYYLAELGLNESSKQGVWTSYNNRKAVWNGGTRTEWWFGFEFVNNDIAETYYIDNLSIIPYYKVTYLDSKGSALATEYVLYDADGKLMTEYTVNNTRATKGCCGFALSKADASEMKIATKVPLENKDIVLYPVTVEGVLLTDGTINKKYDLETWFTFPTPSSLGMSEENFVKWSNGRIHFSAGETVSDVKTIKGEMFSPYYQDASLPAMGFSFEGDGLVDASTAPDSVETVTENGNTYYHIHVDKKDGWYPTDVKFWFPVSRFAASGKNFDPKEYSVFQMRTKYTNVSHITDGVAEEKNQVKTKIRYYIGDGKPKEAPMIGNKEYTVKTDEFVTITCTMSALNLDSWNGSKIDSFLLEPTGVNGSFDAYIDYMRIYRDGVCTVTYDLNAPEDATTSDILHTVAAETGRGVGKGYLLTTDEPVITGYTFVGWAERADASMNDVVTSIDLTGDKTFYAVWIMDEMVIPETLKKNSLRTVDPVGLRFVSLMYLDIKNGTSDISAALKNVRPDAYGFIVSRKSLLNGTDLNFGYGPDENGSGTTFGGVKYVSGLAFDKANGIDKVYDADGSILSDVTAGENEAFTAALMNIPSENYDEIMVARPFVRFGCHYFYGAVREASVRTVALEMYEHFESLSDAEQGVVTEILTATGDIVE